MPQASQPKASILSSKGDVPLRKSNLREVVEIKNPNISEGLSHKY